MIFSQYLPALLVERLALGCHLNLLLLSLLWQVAASSEVHFPQ